MFEASVIVDVGDRNIGVGFSFDMFAIVVVLVDHLRPRVHHQV